MGPLAQGFSPSCNQVVDKGCHQFKSQMGKDLLLNSVMWLLAGFSSMQVVGFRASVPHRLLARDFPHYLVTRTSL